MGKNNAPFVQSVNRGIKNGVCQHGQIEESTKYSRFVKFVIKVCAIFMSEFQKHKKDFPGVDGEAMFVGTVLHSLDHTLMDLNLKVRTHYTSICYYGLAFAVNRIMF